MSRKIFRERLLQAILSFCWREWSVLGAAGGARSAQLWAIDPEALLTASIYFARYEPRLFDEILEWCIENGKWIDLQRLRGIAKRRPDSSRRLLGAVANTLSGSAKGDQRKWVVFAEAMKPKALVGEEQLFLMKDGKSYPALGESLEGFRAYGYLRLPFILRNTARPIPLNTKSAIRFPLRSLFGVGSRAECILYLLTHEGGHPAELAEKIGISVRGVQDALIELSQSGLVLTRVRGKRKIEYWLSQDRWWDFIRGQGTTDEDGPIWVDWIKLFSGLMELWSAVDSAGESDSEYMRSSKLREAFELIREEFARSGLSGIQALPADSPPELVEEEMYRFMTSVLGVENEAS
jgi:hypothetical protein